MYNAFIVAWDVGGNQKPLTKNGFAYYMMHFFFTLQGMQLKLYVSFYKAHFQLAYTTYTPT